MTALQNIILRDSFDRVDPARLTLVTAPAVEPWVATDAEVMQALRLDSDADSALVTLTLKAVRRYFEAITGLCLITQTWRAEFDRLPSGGGCFGFGGASREIVLPRAPLGAISLVQYKAPTTGTLTTFDSANYTASGVGNGRSFARLWLNDSASWPDLGNFPGALQITFTAGFGQAATDVPEEVRLALLFLAAHWYENHLPLDVDGAVPMPLHLESLIEMNRVAFIA